MLKLLAKDGILRRIIESASAAPSIHNTQPWRFTVVADDLLEVHADPDRALWVSDPHARALYLSCGAALFNIKTAIRMTGFNPLVWPLPHPEFAPTVLAAVQAEPGRPPTFAERELYEAIWQRHTNRGPFTDEPIAESMQVTLEQAAGFEFATLRMLTDRDAARVLDMAGQGQRRAGRRRRPPDRAAEVDRDRAAGTTASRPRRCRPARAASHRRSGATCPRPRRPSCGREASYERHPQLAVLTTARDEPSDWLRAGQALQRVLLTATAHGLSASFLYQSIELRDMRGESAPAWPWPENPQIVIRLGYGRAAGRRAAQAAGRRADPGGGDRAQLAGDRRAAQRDERAAHVRAGQS